MLGPWFDPAEPLLPLPAESLPLELLPIELLPIELLPIELPPVELPPIELPVELLPELSPGGALWMLMQPTKITNALTPLCLIAVPFPVQTPKPTHARARRIETTSSSSGPSSPRPVTNPRAGMYLGATKIVNKKLVELYK